MPRRTTVFISAALILVATSAGATLSRITAMGEGSAFYEDDRNVMRWYGSLVDYSDLLTLESGHFTFDDGYKDSDGQTLSGPAVGGQVKLDDAGSWGTLGFYFHARGDDADPGSLQRGYLGSHQTLMWGKRLDTVTIGLMLRNAGDTSTYWSNGQTIRGRQEGGFGLRLDVGDRFYLDLAGEARRYTDRAEGTYSDGTPWKTPGYDSWDNFGFRARGFWGISERLVLVPLIENITEDYFQTLVIPEGITEEATHETGSLWRFGAALNFLRDADSMVVLSADYIDGKVNHDIPAFGGDPAMIPVERYQVFLGKVALEKRAAHWLVGRFSIGYEHLDNCGDFINPSTDSTLLISGGAGFQFADAALDLALAGREPRGFSRYAPTLEKEESDLWISLSLTWEF